MEIGKIDHYLLGLLAACVAYVAYWSYFEFYRFSTFQSSYFDMGPMLSSIYAHIYYPAYMHGLQYLVFEQHMAPLGIAFTAVFALFQNQLSIIIMQDAALALAAIVTYLIGKEIVKSRLVGFAFAIAFLVNAGVRGITYYDFHIESLMPLLVLLAFYFYMKNSRGYFLLSYALLMGVVETAPFVGLALLVGLFAYEIMYNLKAKGDQRKVFLDRMRLLAAAVLITSISIGLYSATASALAGMYKSGVYASTIPPLRLINFFSLQLQTLGNVGGVSYNALALYFYGILGIITLFLGFGITSLVNPLISAILTGPWLGEVFLLHNQVFATFGNEYYEYAIGGAVVGAYLGIIIMKMKGTKLKLFGRPIPHDLTFIASGVIPLSIMISAVIFSLTLPSAPFLINNAPTNFNYTQMEIQLTQIPSNASVMADPILDIHLARVLNLEMPPDMTLPAFTPSGFATLNTSFYWFRPTYIVFDRALPDFSLFNNTKFNIYAYMSSNYTLYSSSSGIEIYKLRAGN